MRFSRILLLSITVALFSYVGYAQRTKELLDEDWNPVSSPDKGVYFRMVTKDASGTLNGPVISYYNPDKARMVGNYSKSRYEGDFTFYYPNGQIESKGKYVNGQQVGYWEEWYANGQPRQQSSYTERNYSQPAKLFMNNHTIENFWDSTGVQLLKDGTGQWYSLRSNGEISEKGQFENFLKEGEWLGYHKGGKPFFQETYHAGRLIKGVSYSEEGAPFTYDEKTKEVMPEYRGGMQALARYLQKALKYPPTARRNKIQGTVYVGFTIGKNGSIKDATVLKGVDPELDNEALRVVKSMPNWKPGIQHGQPVNVRFTLPIKFSIN